MITHRGQEALVRMMDCPIGGELDYRLRLIDRTQAIVVMESRYFSGRNVRGQFENSNDLTTVEHRAIRRFNPDIFTILILPPELTTLYLPICQVSPESLIVWRLPNCILTEYAMMFPNYLTQLIFKCVAEILVAEMTVPSGLNQIMARDCDIARTSSATRPALKTSANNIAPSYKSS